MLQFELVNHPGQRRSLDDSGMGLWEAVVQIRLHLNIFVMDPDEGGTGVDGFPEKFAERDGIECGTTASVIN